MTLAEKIEKKLIFLRERYFRPVIAFPDGHLCHTGDCHIYRPLEIYNTAPCICGFLYDLRWSGSTLCEKLHVKYWDEKAKEDGPLKVPSEEEKQKFNEFLERIFPDFNKKHVPTEKQILQKQKLDELEWSLIEKVFGTLFRTRKEIEWKEHVSTEMSSM